MLHLIKYNLLVKLRNFNMTFWPLVFPLILGTFFFFAFGNLNDADFETVQVAMVQETSPNPLFSFYIDQVKKSNSDLLNIQEMDESAALTALKNKEISGIYYNEMTPSLTVNAHGIPESILQSVLESYNNNLHTIQNILKKHPSGILEGLSQMADTRDLVQELSLGGKTIDGNSQFFYALIAMACLYGCFIGFGAAITLQANLTALAARRCVTPTHKLKLILSEQITSFLLGYTDVIILLIYLRIILKLDFQGQIGKMLIISLFGSLIGVSVGLFVGSLGKLSEGIKVAVILAISMVCSFLAGLMNSNMKDLVEKHAPIINRINPAALISDAFYCINVYDDPTRYYRNVLTLAALLLPPLYMPNGYVGLVGAKFHLLLWLAGIGCALLLCCLQKSLRRNEHPAKQAQIAGLPLYSGVGYRFICFAVFYVITNIYLIRYALKIQKHPELSPMYELDKTSEFRDAADLDSFGKLDARKILIMLVFFASLILIVYGGIKLDWDMSETASVFLALAVIEGVLGGFGPSAISKEFLEGCKKMLGAAFIIGMAQAISSIMNAGHITDTVVHALANGLNFVPTILLGPAMLLANTIINVFLTSGSGQAAAVIPILAPLADLVGVTRQTAILSFNFGDGFCNYVLPTSTALMGIISAVNIPYDRWMKFMWKLFLIWLAVGSVLLMIAQAIHLGPM